MMKSKGRPRHPDVLTPREWEALTLVREGLTNPQIAERMGITLDAAKYHVSEILSKLHMGSREEAAAWQPEPPQAAVLRPSWANALGHWWQLIARIAGAGVMVAAVAGLGVLAYGVMKIEGEDEPNDATATKPSTPPTEAEIASLLNGFLEARVAGEGALQYLNPNAREEDIPLLYATTSGARYERGEFEPVRDVEWPDGYRAFKVRLFAGETVVEQLFFTPYDLALYPGPPQAAADARLRLDYGDNFGADIAPTTEDGQPLPVPYNAFDGEVIVHITHPWVIVPVSGGYSIRRIPEGAGVGPTTDAWGRLVVMVDPARDGAGCPAGPDPADAEALAESIRSDPGLEATAPIAVDAGGTDGLMMDVEIAEGTNAACGGFYGDTGYRSDGFPARPIGLGTVDRMRLYLFDAPEELDVRILAIVIKAPKSGFERAVEGAPPPVEFHAQ